MQISKTTFRNAAIVAAGAVIASCAGVALAQQGGNGMALVIVGIFVAEVLIARKMSSGWAVLAGLLWIWAVRNETANSGEGSWLLGLGAIGAMYTFFKWRKDAKLAIEETEEE